MNLRHEVSNYNENQNVELERAEFSHKLIEERVNKFLQVAGMAINRNNADAKSIASFISTAICDHASRVPIRHRNPYRTNQYKPHRNPYRKQGDQGSILHSWPS